MILIESTDARRSSSPPLPDNWGADADEIARAYECDGLVADPDAHYFRAVTVRAPVAVVFRWLCQLRAAPYSYDFIDNGWVTSPRTLTPGLDALEVGQTVMRIFRLHSFEKDRHLTLVLEDPGGRRLFGDLAVSYAVFPRGKETRLVAKLVVRYPRTLRGKAMGYVLPWGDLVMMHKQLRTLRRLAERHARDETPIDDR